MSESDDSRNDSLLLESEWTTSDTNDTTNSLQPPPLLLICNASITFGGPERTMRIVSDVFVVPLLAAFGLAGNAVAAAVLNRMRSTTSRLLQALAVADSLYLLLCLQFQFLATLHFYLQSVRLAFPRFAHLQLVVWPLAGMAQTSAVWLVVLVTRERYLVVCEPLKARRSLTMTRTRWAVGAVFLWAVLFNLPTAFDLETARCGDQLYVMASKLAHNENYQLVYKFILCFIFRTVLPLVIVVYCNARLLQAVRASSKITKHSSHHHHQITTSSSSSSSSSSPGDDLNHVIILVVTVFVLCETPDVLYRVLRTIKFYAPSFPITWQQMLLLGTVSNLMLTVNSSVNVVIYAVAGRRFRTVMTRQVLQCARSGPDDKGCRPVRI